VFFVDGVGRMNTGSSTPILYENVGRSSDVPELHYVIPIERIPWDAAQAHLNALAGYVERMTRPVPPVGRQKSGLEAYEAWLKAMEARSFIPFGLRYNTVVFAGAKRYAARYLEQAAESGFSLPGLDGVIAAAKETAGYYHQMLDALGMNDPSGSAHLARIIHG
jgi:hypothetical protein